MFVQKLWHLLLQKPQNDSDINSYPTIDSCIAKGKFKKYDVQTFKEKIDSARCRSSTKSCTCANCSNLRSNTECDVCLNPLQGSKVGSCPVCANLVCKDCASKLTKCAFCRTSKPLERNRAVERLLDKLQLPCKNVRNGCKVLVTSDTRPAHEKYCSYATEQCLLDPGCNWNGPIILMEEHFKTAHDLLVTSGRSFQINIDHFQQKVTARKGTQYLGCLKCYDQLFFFQIVLYKQHLMVFSCRVGYLSPVTMYDKNQAFIMRITISSADRVVENGYYDFENTNSQKLNSIKVPCSSFYKNALTDQETDNDVQVTLCIEKDYKRLTKIKTCSYK